MSYAQKKEISGNRTVAVVIVALIHALLGYAIVTGLAYNVIKKAAEDLKTFDVEEEPPPPEEEPPPPPDQPELPPPPMMPPPVVRPPVVQQPIQVVETPVIPQRPPPVIAAPQPPPPPPPPRVVQKAQSMKGSLQGLISGDDYPAAAMRNEEQGTVSIRLTIGSDGRVSGCDIASSSGSSSLDSATCNIIRRRARFTPARDSNGQPTSDSMTQRITWRLE